MATYPITGPDGRKFEIEDPKDRGIADSHKYVMDTYYGKENVSDTTEEETKALEQTAIEPIKEAIPAPEWNSGEDWKPNPKDLREDGTPKGRGWLSVLQRADGGVSSEITITSDFDGVRVLLPLLVPTQSPEDVKWLLENKVDDPKLIPRNIIDTANEHAAARIKMGKSPFVDEELDVYKDFDFQEKHIAHINMATGLVRAVTEGALFGYGGEAAGFVSWLMGRVGAGGDYSSAQKTYEAELKAWQEQNKAANFASEVFGSIATGGAVVKGVGKLAKGAKYLASLDEAYKAKNYSKLAKHGALAGSSSAGLYGSGIAEEGDRLEGLAVGAAVGAAVGVGLPFLVPGVQKLISATGKPYSALVLRTVAKRTAYLMKKHGIAKHPATIRALRELKLLREDFLERLDPADHSIIYDYGKEGFATMTRLPGKKFYDKVEKHFVELDHRNYIQKLVDRSTVASSIVKGTTWAGRGMDKALGRSLSTRLFKIHPRIGRLHRQMEQNKQIKLAEDENAVKAWITLLEELPKPFQVKITYHLNNGEELLALRYMELGQKRIAKRTGAEAFEHGLAPGSAGQRGRMDDLIKHGLMKENDTMSSLFLATVKPIIKDLGDRLAKTDSKIKLINEYSFFPRLNTKAFEKKASARGNSWQSYLKELEKKEGTTFTAAEESHLAEELNIAEESHLYGKYVTDKIKTFFTQTVDHKSGHERSRKITYTAQEMLRKIANDAQAKRLGYNINVNSHQYKTWIKQERITSGEYELAGGALRQYIYDVNEKVSTREFFGLLKEQVPGIHKTMVDGNFDGAIGSVVAELRRRGEFSVGDAKELEELLTARFVSGSAHMDHNIRNAKNFFYLPAMGIKVTSGLNQLGDLSIGAVYNGILPTLKSLARQSIGGLGGNKAKIDVNTFGFHSVMEDMADTRGMAKWVDYAFKNFSFVHQTDNLGKNTTLQAGLRTFQERARTGDGQKSIMRQIGEDAWSPDEWRVIFKDLLDGKLTKDTMYLPFHVISDAQSINKSEIPQWVASNPNGRILTALKNHVFKQIDAVRKHGFDLLDNPLTAAEGLRFLTRYGLFVGAGATGTAEFANFVLNRDSVFNGRKDLSELSMYEAAFGVLKNIGLSSLIAEAAEDGRVYDTVGYLMAPTFISYPAKWMIKDIPAFYKGEDKDKPVYSTSSSIDGNQKKRALAENYAPYWQLINAWFGDGAEVWQHAEDKRVKEREK